MPNESEGLGPLVGGRLIIGSVPGVNDESARLIDNFEPTTYELEVLARHYLNEFEEINFFWRCHQQTGSEEIRMKAFARRRLERIAEVLGEEVFNAAIAQVSEKWDKRFAEVDEEERKLGPCRDCGKARKIADAHVPEERCGECSYRREESELPRRP